MFVSLLNFRGLNSSLTLFDRPTVLLRPGAILLVIKLKSFSLVGSDRRQNGTSPTQCTRGDPEVHQVSPYWVPETVNLRVGPLQ